MPSAKTMLRQSRTFTPSSEQQQAFARLGTRRSLCVQVHWRWRAGGAVALQRRALSQALVTEGGSTLSESRCDLLAAGTEQPSWHWLSLWQLPKPEALQRLIDSAEFQALAAKALEIRVIVASPAPAVRQRLFTWLGRVLPYLPKPARGESPESELVGGINPTRKQADAFAAADQKQTIHMFNLLKFHTTACYANASSGRSGQEAYVQRYAPVALQCIYRLGGRLVALGRYRLTLISADGDPALGRWDEFAVAQYPNRAAFTHMIGNPLYVRALKHRHAGLAETELWSATPEGG